MALATTALIVDDDPQIADSVRGMLPRRSVKLETTANVREAIDCLRQHSYCGLVLNLALSSGPGVDVLQHIARAKIRIPIVVIAAVFPDAVREMPGAESIKLVLSKPIDPSLLASIILGLCGIER